MRGVLRTMLSAMSLALGLTSVLGAYGAAANAKDYRLCIGEYDEKCPVSHDVFAGCGADPDIVAENTCAITLQGQKKYIPHRLIHQGSHDGNRCGYEWYSIECIDQ